MSSFNVLVETTLFNKLLTKFKTRKATTDAISLRLEQMLRMERRKVIMGETTDTRVTDVEVHIPDYLSPYVNEYCINRNISKAELIKKIITKML
jgi:hypothetical protein